MKSSVSQMEVLKHMFIGIQKALCRRCLSYLENLQHAKNTIPKTSNFRATAAVVAAARSAAVLRCHGLRSAQRWPLCKSSRRRSHPPGSSLEQQNYTNDARNSGLKTTKFHPAIHR